MRHGAPGRGRALRGIGSAHGALAYATRVCRRGYKRHKMIMTLGTGERALQSRHRAQARRARRVRRNARHVARAGEGAGCRRAPACDRASGTGVPRSPFCVPCHGSLFVAARAPYGGVQCGTVRLAVAARCAVGRRSCMRDPGQRGCDALPACAAGAAAMFARQGVHQKLCPFGTLLVQLGPQAQS